MVGLDSDKKKIKAGFRITFGIFYIYLINFK